MSLKEYVKKRFFDKTTEPKGGKSTGKKLNFVVQRHHASHLHYDFRLELDGTLKSWAVPKGPSMNPGDKRLAMMVEDHPIDYQHFEGIIPNGNYGAGVVLIWDHGTYKSLADERAEDLKILRASLRSGNLKFKLNGEKLKGEFALVKLDGAEDNSWLLIKHNDQFAVHQPYNSEEQVPQEIKEMLNNKSGQATRLPQVKKNQSEKKNPDLTEEPDGERSSNRNYTPMMSKLEGRVLDKPDWICEKKMHGYRAISYTGKKAKLILRNGIDFSHTYMTVLDALKMINEDAVVDRELVIEDKNGKSRFQHIQNYQGDTEGLAIKCYVFDLLDFSGHDLRELELYKRKALLKTLTTSLKSKRIIDNDHIAGNGSELFRKARKECREGIAGKDANSYCNSGKRSDRWLKFKLQISQEAIICGYTTPAGSRKHFGALVSGLNDGKNKVYW